MATACTEAIGRKLVVATAFTLPENAPAFAIGPATVRALKAGGTGATEVANAL